MRNQGVDYSIYGRALLLLAKNPSIIALPLLAAVIDVLVRYVGAVTTDPLGGLGSNIFAFISQIVYLFAFGAAIIQANNAARGYKAGFDEAWEEARRKAGGIVIAAVGFVFIGSLGAYVAQLLPIPFLGIALQLIAYFFLIFTIPAAAIGGLPGGMAISASFQTVRANVAPAIVLAIAYAIVFFGLPQLALVLGAGLSPFVYSLVVALVNAVALAYLAFPFATTYDDIAFKRW
jgi:hypothetical protein